MLTSYARQDRGDAGAYDRYLASMDTSMRQKVALTAAHLMARGTVADMGMGSGSGSHALASLYPGLRVIGVDVNPEMVARARERYPLPNLEFREGDIAGPCFPEGTLDGIFDSSVLHHVTSFTGYDHGAARRALEAQVGQLRQHGVLIVRDFVSPGEQAVVLELPCSDGTGEEPCTCSTAALFRRFSREFRRGSTAPGFELVELAPAADGWARFSTSHRLATEFLLRKDYRADWDVEILEEYTYFTQADCGRVFAGLGLRTLASTPLWNPWIVRRRFEGRCRLLDSTGAPLGHPPTNFVVVGERVAPDEGVRIEEREASEPLGFLRRELYRHRATGAVRELVRRPHLTVDLLPWFRRDGEVFVLVRQAYPRPILTCREAEGGLLDGSLPASYVAEPLSVLLRDRPLGQTVELALRERAGLEPAALRQVRRGGQSYPSPGGTLEEVQAVLVEIEPVDVPALPGGVSGFSTSGRVSAVEAGQLLRAAQVGGLPDARLEMHTHELLARLGEPPGPWIGDVVELSEARNVPPPTVLGALLERPRRRDWEALGEGTGAFLDLRCSWFHELAADGSVLRRVPLEYAVPRTRSLHTAACAVLALHEGTVLLGLDEDDLPAGQAFEGHSDLLVAPAWRLPLGTRSLSEAKEWVSERLHEEHGLEIGGSWELGGRYHPSPGVSPEAVYPLAVEVLDVKSGLRPLHFVPLAEVIAGLDHLRDGHLRVVARRAAHALGLL